ncbi:MAG: RES family NAD+ phosphorylase, partial [Alcaligenaceae bacterium]|nr:RES family NAD+ phosphorylase [Alcaligenaceae bacterium]
MSCTTWTPHAVSSEATDWQATIWRMVEAQHTASTMKIVDSHDEQDILETLIEGAKPTSRAQGLGLHYLLASPFRYPPRQDGGSRFRAPVDPGVFYGAGTVHTAAAVLGYWRWRFLRDAVDLISLDPVAHTA